jgi:hypothetical protein
MTDIELINEDGVIKGVDPETGEEVPIELDDLITTSVDTDKQIIGNQAFDASGGDLSSVISDGLANGQSHFDIKEPNNGNWTWESNLTVDPTAYAGGVTINARGTRITDNSSGWSLIVDSGGNVDAQLHGRTFEFHGGHWLNNATNPIGFLQIKDLYKLYFQPDSVDSYSNNSDDSVALSIENHDSWSESWMLSGHIRNCDIGVDFVPASITGGTGTDSFQHGNVNHLHVDSIRQIGIRWRGVLAYCDIGGLAVYPGTDGAVGQIFDANFAETAFTAPKHESFASNCTGIETKTNYANAPLLIQPSFVTIDTSVSKSNNSHNIRELFADNFKTNKLMADEALEVDQTTIKSKTVTLSDDSATSILVSNSKRCIVLGEGSSVESGDFLTGFNSLTTVATKNMSNENSAQLSGTTGPDGSINISRDDNDLYIENRTGTSKDITVELHLP